MIHRVETRIKQKMNEYYFLVWFLAQRNYEINRRTYQCYYSYWSLNVRHAALSGEPLEWDFLICKIGMVSSSLDIFYALYTETIFSS